MTDRLVGQPQALPPQSLCRPVQSLCRPVRTRRTRPAGLAGRNCEDIVRIVLRGLCGYESVGEICEAEGISRRDYNRWRRDFIQACKDWPHNDACSYAQAGREYSAGDDGWFERLAIEQANDIIERADDRLTTAWLTEKQMSSRHFTDAAMP